MFLPLCTPYVKKWSHPGVFIFLDQILSNTYLMLGLMGLIGVFHPSTLGWLCSKDRRCHEHLSVVLKLMPQEMCCTKLCKEVLPLDWFWTYCAFFKKIYAAGVVKKWFYRSFQSNMQLCVFHPFKFFIFSATFLDLRNWFSVL